MTVADRIAVMDHGKLVQVATPATIYEQPATRYVADFIGDVNILECKVTGRVGEEVLLSNPLASVPLRVTQQGEARTGDTVFLAVRPEKLRISLDPPADPLANLLEGQIWDIGYLGDLSIYHVETPSGTRIKVSRPNLSRVVERPITWEDKVYVTFSPDAGVVLVN